MGWKQLVKLTAEDGTAGDHFGVSVSLDGDYALIGASCDNPNGTNSGSAYIFKRSDNPNDPNWYQQTKLLPNDGDSGDYFGCSVSLNGDYALVGAYGKDYTSNNVGSAYVFRRSDDPNDSNWYQQARLRADDRAADDEFGCSVSLDNDYAVIGAWGDDDYGEDSGSAYIFKRDGTNWNQQAKLTADDGDDNDNFGVSVCLNGEYALIGAYGDDVYAYNSGSAYVFKRDSDVWSRQAKLFADDGDSRDRFGVSVSLDGDYAVIGTFWDDDDGEDSGSAYIFRRDGTNWHRQAKLLAHDGAAGDEFGRSVSLGGDYAIVGAWADDDNGDDSGSAYIFSCPLWTE
jgi:hypothetical protein